MRTMGKKKKSSNTLILFKICLFLLRELEEREGEMASTCWFTPLMPQRPETSQGLQWLSHVGGRGPKCLDHFLLLSQGDGLEA